MIDLAIAICSLLLICAAGLIVTALIECRQELRKPIPPDPAIREAVASLDAIWELTPDDQQTRERIARLMRDLALVQGVRS